MSEPAYRQMVCQHRLFRPKRRFVDSYVPAAVFLDAALLLLAFFLVTSRFVLMPGVRIDLPETPFRDGVGASAAVLTVAQEGTVYCNDERITMDALPESLAELLYRNPEAELIIEADRSIEYGTLVRIYNEAMAAGIRQVSLATRVSSLRGDGAE